MGIIYRAINLDNNKSYIGQTTSSLKRRIQQHQTTNKCLLFHRAIEKHGIEKFSWEILCECSKEELDEKESFYIKEYNTISPYGYNLTSGGAGCIGYKHDDASKEKIGAVHRGKVLSKETKEKMSISHVGLKHTKETREKMKLRKNGMLGKKHSEETKRKMSKVMTGKKRPDITERNSKRTGEKNPMFGKKHTSETRKKISEKRWGKREEQKSNDRLTKIFEV